jgi:hypothetical protein
MRAFTVLLVVLVATVMYSCSGYTLLSEGMRPLMMKLEDRKDIPRF